MYSKDSISTILLYSILFYYIYIYITKQSDVTNFVTMFIRITKWSLYGDGIQKTGSISLLLRTRYSISPSICVVAYVER